MSFYSVQQLLEDSEREGLPLWETVLRDDLLERGAKREESFGQMEHMWRVMKSSSEEYNPSDHSNSGLTGGDAQKVADASKAEKLIGGAFFSEVISEALKIGECNACMKRIVATPTAGSCGVLPAVFLPLLRTGAYREEAFVEALYVAAGFGQVIAQRASIAGAEGGCQAEIGSASAMAAAALVALQGGTKEQCADACAIALSNLMGLVCDPVAGLVEIPCVNRNVVGAVNALSCANLALSGVESRIPADEVIDAMSEVGARMPSDLKETGRGGLAATPTGRAIARRLNGSEPEEV